MLSKENYSSASCYDQHYLMRKRLDFRQNVLCLILMYYLLYFLEDHYCLLCSIEYFLNNTFGKKWFVIKALSSSCSLKECSGTLWLTFCCTLYSGKNTILLVWHFSVFWLSVILFCSFLKNDIVQNVRYFDMHCEQRYVQKIYFESILTYF